MDRPRGQPVAAVMVAAAELDFAADLLRRGIARLDPFDTEVLAQQPTLLQLAQHAIGDPDVRSKLIRDEAYQRAVRNAAERLAR